MEKNPNLKPEEQIEEAPDQKLKLTINDLDNVVGGAGDVRLSGLDEGREETGGVGGYEDHKKRKP